MASCLRLVRTLIALTLAVAAAACASGGAGRGAPASAPSSPADTAGSPLEGEWRLVALERADGAPRSVTGFLRFDRFSNITVHAELAPDDATARPPRTVVADFTAKAAQSNGRFDYQGLRLGVDSERLASDAVPMSDWRYFAVDGDTLRLWAQVAGRPAATLVFQRVR